MPVQNLSMCDLSDLNRLVESGIKFPTILMDPPWRYGNKASRGAAENHYPTMSLPEIASLPVGELATKNAHLHLWTTNGFLFEAERLMQMWDFIYKSMLVWTKPQMGCGSYWRVSHEFLLLGVKGKLTFADRSPHKVQKHFGSHRSGEVSPINAPGCVCRGSYLWGLFCR
jgi:N6-adenosine-specific RNA methylase IME4